MLALCERRALSLAEVAAVTRLPLGVARILVSDLVSAGLVVLASHSVASSRSADVLERVLLCGLRKLSSSTARSRREPGAPGRGIDHADAFIDDRRGKAPSNSFQRLTSDGRSAARESKAPFAGRVTASSQRKRLTPTGSERRRRGRPAPGSYGHRHNSPVLSNTARPVWSTH